MNTKSRTSVLLKTQSMASGFLLAALLAAVGVSNAWSATRAEDRARGEEMIRKAHLDLVEANRLTEVAIKAAEVAQHDQEAANQKRIQARRLEREGYLLFRDANRIQAAEIRARAETQELQVRSESVELTRLQGLLAHENQTFADTTSAAANMRDAAKNAPAPAEKAELGKMADALSAQAAAAGSEAAALQKRAAAVLLEIDRLKGNIKRLSETAQRLAPMDK